MKRTILLATITAALLASTASAATIDDLRNLGYSVGAASQCEGGGIFKTVWYVSGFGNSSYFSECDPGFQSAVDSWANPVGFCNVKWQYQHPEQLAAFQAISGKGWALSGDQCADTYTVTNPNDSTVAYSGGGGGLPGFNDSHGNPPAAQVTPGSGAAAPAPVPPSNCLPLCPNPGDTRGGGGVLIPAPAPVVTTSGETASPALAAAVATATAAPADTVVDPSSYTVIAATPQELAANPDVLGWLNTPYVTTPLLAPAA